MVSRFEKYHLVAKTTTSYRPTFTQSLNLLLTAAKSVSHLWVSFTTEIGFHRLTSFP